MGHPGITSTETETDLTQSQVEINATQKVLQCNQIKDRERLNDQLNAITRRTKDIVLLTQKFVLFCPASRY